MNKVEFDYCEIAELNNVTDRIKNFSLFCNDYTYDDFVKEYNGKDVNDLTKLVTDLKSVMHIHNSFKPRNKLWLEIVCKHFVYRNNIKFNSPHDCNYLNNVKIKLHGNAYTLAEFYESLPNYNKDMFNLPY